MHTLALDPSPAPRPHLLSAQNPCSGGVRWEDGWVVWCYRWQGSQMKLPAPATPPWSPGEKRLPCNTLPTTEPTLASFM